MRSHLQPQRHFLETDGFTQNRRQKVVNRRACVCAGGLYVCAEGSSHSKLTKVALIYNVSYFNLVGLGALFGGISLAKPPVATGLVSLHN